MSSASDSESDSESASASSASESESASASSASASSASASASGEDEDEASASSAESGTFSASSGGDDEDDDDELSGATSESGESGTGTVSDGSGESGSDSESSDASSESSGNSIVPDLGADEDDEFEPARKKGILEYLGLGGEKDATPPLSEAGSDEGDAYKYDFDDDAPLADDDYDFPDDEDDDEPLEEGLKDDQLEKRLEMAFAFTTRESGRMEFDEFRQAVSMMGKVFTKEETDAFYREAMTFESDPKALGNSTERDDRGLLKRNTIQSTRKLLGEHLSQKGFVAFFEKYLTRTVDPKEAAEHFRALVEGAAEMVLRDGEEGGDGGDEDAIVNDELRQMKDTKHVPINKIFIYAKDLRKVMVAFSEKLTDEEADVFIRECKPKPLAGAQDGGLERVYFHQYLTMLKDDTV